MKSSQYTSAVIVIPHSSEDGCGQLDYKNSSPAPLTIAKIWKPLKYLSTEEWIKKMWYMYTTGCYPAIKKNEIMPFAATWMNLEIITLSEVRKSKTNTI